MVEQEAVNFQVIGSNPICPATKIYGEEINTLSTFFSNDSNDRVTSKCDYKS